MLKFTTITPISKETFIDDIKHVKPLINLDNKPTLKESKIIGKEAKIVGNALKIAGFDLPCFYEGDISELDKTIPNILMVLPSGEYPIKVKLDRNGIYLLDLK